MDMGSIHRSELRSSTKYREHIPGAVELHKERTMPGGLILIWTKSLAFPDRTVDKSQPSDCRMEEIDE